MKIGILGTRGIPNAYGGFEQFAQYLSLGLVQRGHSVWVYNSSDHPYQQSEWNGIRIIHCKDWESSIGTAGQFLYDLNCLKDARKRDFDILLQLGYTSNSVWYPLWPKRMWNIVNMDGLEWKRSKYGPMTRRFLKRAEGWAARHAHLLIADSPGIQDYIQKEYCKSAIYIPYGAEIPTQYDASIPAARGLQPDAYFLLMARMEPENNIEMVIRGWLDSGREKPLVLIGNTGNSFGREMVAKYPHDKLIFMGAIYDPAIVNSLRHYASFYFHGHSVGGTNPSLLEAMACGCPVIAHDNPFNKAILGTDAGYFSSAADITRLLAGLPAPALAAGWKEKNIAKIRDTYNWDRIVDDYENVFTGKAAAMPKPAPGL